MTSQPDIGDEFKRYSCHYSLMYFLYGLKDEKLALELNMIQTSSMN